jgi:hypothetical protein
MQFAILELFRMAEWVPLLFAPTQLLRCQKPVVTMMEEVELALVHW